MNIVIGYCLENSEIIKCNLAVLDKYEIEMYIIPEYLPIIVWHTIIAILQRLIVKELNSMKLTFSGILILVFDAYD